MNPHIILLNGTSSSGKTSLAKALQAASLAPYFHVCIDAFEDMIPQGHPDGQPIDYADLLRGALEVMYVAIASLASKGHLVIVDHVLIEDEEPANWIDGYLSAVAPYKALNVRVYAPLEALQARELARGDRRIGLAEWQSSRMHRAIQYDLEIDTSIVSPEQGADRILKLMTRGLP